MLGRAAIERGQLNSIYPHTHSLKEGRSGWQECGFHSVKPSLLHSDDITTFWPVLTQPHT